MPPSAKASSANCTNGASASGSASPAAASGSVERQGDDPAYAAIDAILGLHDDGVIVEMDLDDDDAKWEVDVVVGDDVKEYDVTTGGQVSEGVRPQIDDDVRRAGEAQVTAETAISTAPAKPTGPPVTAAPAMRRAGGTVSPVTAR